MISERELPGYRTVGSIRPVLSVIFILVVYSLTLSLLKFMLSRMTGSEAIASDGWNNFADTMYAILLAVGFYFAAQPSDDSHPHGHRRFESLVGLGVGAIIVSTGIYILIECAGRWKNPPALTPDFFAIALMAAMMVSKFLVAALCLNTGRRHNRPALVSVGRDQQMDVLATLSALLGYGGGTWWTPAVDPLFAGIISIWVFKVGGETLYENFNQLTGRRAAPEVHEAIASEVKSMPIFSKLTDLRTHYVGPEIQVSVTVLADKNLKLGAVHDAEEELKSRIGRIPGVNAVFVHIEPDE